MCKKLGEYKILETETIYTHKLLKLNIQKIKTPKDKIVNWINISHKGAVAILPIDEDGNILLIKQYRNNALGYVYEIPAGCIEKGEDPLETAKRELEEETGYKCNKIKKMFSFFPAIGTSDEKIHFYIAKDLIKTSTNFDEDEIIETYKFKIDNIIEMIDTGKIVDGKLITAVMSYIARREFYSL